MLSHMNARKEGEASNTVEKKRQLNPSSGSAEIE